MCMGLDRDLDLACPRSDGTGSSYARRFSGFFLAEVEQNSFPSSPEVHNH
jgi:hypothetical protein